MPDRPRSPPSPAPNGGRRRGWSAARRSGYALTPRGGSPSLNVVVARVSRCLSPDNIRGLFDNIDHELLLRALRKHCDERWVLLLVERWLTAPMREQDGIEHPRTVGTPQGGPLSPVLANLFLHYALDRWLATHHPDIPFCRYADDGILHCRTETQANRMREHLDARLRACKLELHPDKTRCCIARYSADFSRIRPRRSPVSVPRCADHRAGLPRGSPEGWGVAFRHGAAHRRA